MSIEKKTKEVNEIEEQFIEEKNDSSQIITLNLQSNNLKDKFHKKKGEKKKNLNKKIFAVIYGLVLIVLCSCFIYSENQRIKNFQEKKALLDTKIEELSKYTTSCKIRNLANEKEIVRAIGNAADICGVYGTIVDAKDIIEGFEEGRGAEVIIKKGLTYEGAAIGAQVGGFVLSVFGPAGTAVGALLGSYIGGNLVGSFFGF